MDGTPGLGAAMEAASNRDAAKAAKKKAEGVAEDQAEMSAQIQTNRRMNLDIMRTIVVCPQCLGQGREYKHGTTSTKQCSWCSGEGRLQLSVVKALQEGKISPASTSTDSSIPSMSLNLEAEPDLSLATTADQGDHYKLGEIVSEMQQTSDSLMNHTSELTHFMLPKELRDSIGKDMRHLIGLVAMLQQRT